MAKKKICKKFLFFFSFRLLILVQIELKPILFFLNLSQSRNSHGFAAAPVKLPSSASLRIEMGKAVNGTETLVGKILHTPKIPGPAADRWLPAHSSLYSWPLS